MLLQERFQQRLQPRPGFIRKPLIATKYAPKIGANRRA